MPVLHAGLVKLAAFPFLLLVRVLLLPLNMFPSRIYEAVDRYDAKDRPDLREGLAPMKGRRRLGLGTAIIAWQRGVTFPVSFQGHRWRGVYKDDFEALMKFTF
jgi:hypothetical protein